MLLLVGLGNPGAKYEATRHNAGFLVMDELADRAGITRWDKRFKAQLAKGRLADEDVIFVKPQTYMNLSGESVGPALGFYKLPTASVVVVHDELDLPVGQIKLKRGGGHGGHNGLRSLKTHLPDDGFIRVRVGIGRPPPQWDPADYVLSRFSAGERAEVEQSIESAADAVEKIVTDGVAKAMNFYNQSKKALDKKREQQS